MFRTCVKLKAEIQDFCQSTFAFEYGGGGGWWWWVLVVLEIGDSQSQSQNPIPIPILMTAEGYKQNVNEWNFKK
jgi:hypothetical protein